MGDDTSVDSFVLRFVREMPTAEVRAGPLAWRGLIRHVQSDRARPFSRWAEALAFIREFVDLGEEAANE